MTDSPPPRVSYSGRQRIRKTQPSVRWANRIAGTVITIGGISTVAAVALVCVFLVSVAVPIFFPPKSMVAANQPLARGNAPTANVERFEVDEYRSMAWTMDAQGQLALYFLHDGSRISLTKPFGDAVPSVLRFVEGNLVAGFADGSLRYGEISFSTSFTAADELPAEVRATVERQGTAVHGNGVIAKLNEDQYRVQTLSVRLQDAVMMEEGAAITAIDMSMKNTGPVIAALTSSGTLHLKEVSVRRNWMTGKDSIQLFGGTFALPQPEGESAPPHWLRLAGLGDNVFAVWDSGHLLRVDSSNFDAMRVVESLNVLSEGARVVTLVDFLIGKTSLVIGDDRGHVDVWFRIKPEGAETPDGANLVRAHRLEAMPAAVRALAVSARSRMIGVADADGNSQLYYVTNQRTLGRLPGGPLNGGVLGLALSPKDDGLFALASDAIRGWDLKIPHPEINLKQVFGKVWYEGYTAPKYVWQSSSGTDDFEPKYGLVPLVFGTIKATVYSLFFGVPLALLAAIYTSEMMKPRLRAKVKPTIEVMASLPSVVLGFLAALVIAPAVENAVPTMLMVMVTLPFALLLGAHLWQLIPAQLGPRVSFLRLPVMLLAAAAGLHLAAPVGDWFEARFWLGDIKRWLSSREGSGTGGWVLLLLPFCGVFCAWANARWVTARARAAFATRSRLAYAAFDLLRFLLSCLATCLLAWALGVLLAEGFGRDPRGGLLGTYDQRNALIVGFVMGFAIIPIIYTLAEDALSAVPETLRAASLGAGATPWQTATRIIIPTAASGLFSAVMIGFGRAVGETMIVLMAAGNTPVLEWNMFNGFRTLSANIAVELPEAVRDSTHYRMLFLAALSLFVMTFCLNSVAESVRQRFRKRAFEL